ncbi:hypothetical protein HZC53_03885 [Candidatus Uhrbacteria bacterium]|nr:hypothetical protein [Candidatus Uhrbacteria bacterium]
METTVDRKSTYFVTAAADTSLKCHACGNKTCRRDYSAIQIRIAGFSVSAMVPSKRCMVCRTSRIGATDLNFVELAAVSELLTRGIRGHEILDASKSALGLLRLDLANILKMQRDDLAMVLRGEADLKPKQWVKVVDLVQGSVYRYLRYRQPIPLRVTKPRIKK